MICVEGEERHCQLYVQLLQRLRWKRFTVRGEQQVEGAAGDTIETLRSLPRGFIEYQQEEMHLFAAHLKQAGLEELFMTFMKGYKHNNDDNDDDGGDDGNSSGKEKRKKKKPNARRSKR